MAQFIVHNTIFQVEIPNDSGFIVNSKIKNYSVEFQSTQLEAILENFYVPGDIIIADSYFSCSINKEKKYRNSIFIKATEDNKTIEKVLECSDLLFGQNMNKANKLIVIGGGIIQEISGFLAAIYKRGIPWIFIPTTLLAMSDSCIGGKVSLNRHAKNMLGLYNPPDRVIISDSFISTLNQDMILSGIGECLKMAIIGGKNEYKLFMEYYNEKNYLEILRHSLYLKKTIIEKDEMETDERKVLNYGHTIGHAIEIWSNYFIPHGIAVLLGIQSINKLFQVKTMNSVNRFITDIMPEKYRLYMLNIDWLEIISLMKMDKKNIGNQICFVVLEDFGVADFKYLSVEKVQEIMTR